jgi:chromosome segregation ATPase
LNKPSSIKNWLKIGSVAFGVSCGCTLPFTQNLAQSALIGLATVPGMAASMVVKSRQRRQQVYRQLQRGKLRLQQLQHRGAILARQLEIGHQHQQEIEMRVAQLHSLAANVNDRIDRDRDRQQQLERQLAVLAIYYQEQESIATNLESKIQAQQAYLLEVEQTGSFQVQSAQISLKTTNDRDSIVLTDLQVKIDLSLVIKQELELEIQQLQDRIATEYEQLDRSISEQHSVIVTLDLAIESRQQDYRNAQMEIDKLNNAIATKMPELASQEQKLVDLKLQLSETELALQSKQVELGALAGAERSIENIQDEYLDLLSDSRLQRELKIAQLELSSRQAELDNLKLKIYASAQSIDAAESDRYRSIFEPQPPNIVGGASPLENREIDLSSATDIWYNSLIDNPHLTVLKHIEKHGTITEAEASSKLGNARSVRQFANKLEEYAPILPFAIRVESSPQGNRYIKEDRH